MREAQGHEPSIEWETYWQYFDGSDNPDTRRDALRFSEGQPWSELDTAVGWAFRPGGPLGDSGHWRDIGTGNGYVGMRAYWVIKEWLHDSFNGSVLCVDKFPANYARADAALRRIDPSSPVRFAPGDSERLQPADNPYAVQTWLNEGYQHEKPWEILHSIAEQAAPGGDVIVATKDPSHYAWALDVCDEAAEDFNRMTGASAVTKPPRWYERFDTVKVVQYKPPSLDLSGYHVEDTVLAIPRDVEKRGDRKGIKALVDVVLSFADSMYDLRTLEHEGRYVPANSLELRQQIVNRVYRKFENEISRDGLFRSLRARRGIFHFQKQD